MVITLIILFNNLISIYDIYKFNSNILLKNYSRKTFYKLININQYFCYIFFKNLYFQSIGSFIPLICKKLFKIQPSWFPYFYTSVNIKLFLFIHVISSLGLIFNKEIGLLFDYYFSDTNSLYYTKEYADVILNNNFLKNNVIHVDLPDDLKTVKSNKNIIQIIIICTTLSIIYLSINTF
jgi:hypothetical protein